MSNKNKTINIGKNKDSYEMPLNLNQMSTYLEYFSSNANRDLGYIYNLLDLDSSSRKKNDNTIEFKTDVKERRNLRNINKALTMELFASGMFGYIDHPTEVNANCLVSYCQSKGSVDDMFGRVLPSIFAQGNVPDVQINYGKFMVILEVSAKYQPSLEDYKKQLNGALKHARSIREEGYEKPIYCVLVNERSLCLVENKYAMKEVLEDIKLSEQIYITAMSTEEFSALGKEMADSYEKDIANMNSDELYAVLKATAEKGINGKFHEKLVESFGDDKNKPNGSWF